jgi:carbonic anhydrase
MSLLHEILNYNADFVSRKGYEPFVSDRYPDKKLVILSCMDTRLVELLPHAMNIRNGDVKIIKNAGAIVSHPFGSVMRSILVAIYSLGANEVAVIGHTGCGMAGMQCDHMLDKVKQFVPEQTIATVSNSGIDLNAWFTGFKDVETGVTNSVAMIRSHPLLPPTTPVHGLMIDSTTGKLTLLVDGYQK